jgi:hypothetical protein
MSGSRRDRRRDLKKTARIPVTKPVSIFAKHLLARVHLAPPEAL